MASKVIDPKDPDQIHATLESLDKKRIIRRPGFLNSLKDLEEQILYLRKRGGYPDKDKITDKDLQWLIGMADDWGLDLAKRELYLLPGQDVKLHVGYHVYLRRAIESGLLASLRIIVHYAHSQPDDLYQEFGEGAPLGALVKIDRKDWKETFFWTALFREVQRSTFAWQQMPTFMLKKTAISQALRICFADILGGFPYTEEEVGE